MSEFSYSPCEGFCHFDAGTHVCRKCFRTIDEVEAWDDLSRTDKQIVLKSIEKRKSVMQYYQDKSVPDLSCLV